MQTAIVAVLVVGCAGYAAWTLMPSGGRRALARALLPGPWPRFIADKLRQAMTPGTGCGCDGCDRAPVKATPAAGEVITFHPRPRR